MAASVSTISTIALPPDWTELRAKYHTRVRDELNNSILPFWWRTIDEQFGGVFNCWNNAGTQLVRRDKFTWSQGRLAWLWSRMASTVTNGVLPGHANAYLAHAGKTVNFLRRHAFLPDGRCAFRLSETGVTQDVGPGLGLAPSIYADCFVAMGLAEFARVACDREVFNEAWALAENIEARIASGDFVTYPDPIPDGYESHAITMIRLNVALVIQRAAEELEDGKASQVWRRGLELTERIVNTFLDADGRWRELRPRSFDEDETLLSRHMNPGHALESAWILLSVAVRAGRTEWVERVLSGVEFACTVGWDAEAGGGLLHFVDHAGGSPRGAETDSLYEKAVRGAWSAKLWWVHSEAIYTTLLSYRLSGRTVFRDWFERVSEYTFRVFPQPDAKIGEWIQIRDRQGQPLERVVALPVKDPYHIARNLIQVLELFSSCEPLPPP